MEWWTPQTAGILGAVLGGGGGALCGVLGSLIGVCAPRGIARGPLLGSMYLFVFAGLVSVITGIVALVMGQPWHVYGVLLLPGFIMSVVVGTLIPVVRVRYAQAEHRRMNAESVRHS